MGCEHSRSKNESGSRSNEKCIQSKKQSNYLMDPEKYEFKTYRPTFFNQKEEQRNKKNDNRFEKNFSNSKKSKEEIRDGERANRDCGQGGEMLTRRDKTEKKIEEEFKRKCKNAGPGPRLDLIGSLINLNLFKKCSDKPLWFDLKFPSGNSSIVQEGTRFDVMREILGWARISEIYQPDFDAFKHKVTTDDMCQGRLGNCYLISSMAALASKQHLITKICRRDSSEYANKYSIDLFDAGKWKKIDIDDYIPYTNKGPIFCRADRKNTWPILLEKAYAKLFGTYQNIESGDSAEALTILTGAPSKIFTRDKASGTAGQVSRKEKMWQFIKNSLKEGFPLTTGTPEFSRDLEVSSQHGYSIMDIREGTVRGAEIRLVKLRDPRSELGLSRELNRKSESVGASFGDLIKSDGTEHMAGYFWLEYNDFCTKFERVVASKVKEGFENNILHISQTMTSNSSVVLMEVARKSEIYLTAYQKSERHFPKSSGFKCSYSLMMVARIDEEGDFEFIKGKTGVRQQTTISATFEPGRYLILLEVDWNQGICNQVYLDAYTNIKVCFEIQESTQYDELCRKLIKAYVRSTNINFEPVYDKYNGIKVQKNARHYNLLKFGFSVHYYVNEEKDAVFNVTLDFYGLDNSRLIYPSGFSNSISLSIKPGCEDMTIHKIKPRIIEINHTKKSIISYSNSAISSHYFQYKLEEIIKLCREYGEISTWNKVIKVALSYVEGSAHVIFNNSTNKVTISQLLDCKNMKIDTLHGPKKIGDLLYEVIPPGEVYIINFSKDKPGQRSELPSEGHLLKMTWITYRLVSV